MADELEDLDGDDLADVDPAVRDTLPAAKVPERRDQRRHAGIIRRKIGLVAPRRRALKRDLEVHEVAPTDSEPEPRNEWGEEEVVADDVWDEDPTEVEESESGGEEPRRVAKWAPDAEVPWGSQGTRVNLAWVTAGAVTLVVLGVLLGRADRNREPAVRVVEPERFQSQTLLSETAMADLLTMGREVLPRMTELLLIAQGDPAEAAPALAGGEYSAALMADWRKRVGPVSPIKEDGIVAMSAAVLEGNAYLVVSGLRNDYSKYLAYFVEKEGELVIDWRATVGFSEVLPNEVADMPTDKSLLMRAIALPSSFYTLAYPESDYACYLLSHIDREEYAWGYVRRDSVVHDQLDGALKAPLTRPADNRVTLTVRKGRGDGLPNQLVIDEVVGADWLSLRAGR